MKNRFFSMIILCISILLFSSATTEASTYTIGDGDNQIESKEEFLAFLKGDKINRNPSDFYLTTDIDLGGATITPLRINDGSLDGNGHTISNYVISERTDIKNNDTKYVGLIRFNRGTIKNLKIKNATVSGNYVVGALVGANNSSNNQKAIVSNIEAENVTVVGHTDVGGLIGNNTSSGAFSNAVVDNCTVIGNISVKGYSTCGSLLGFNRATFTNSKVDCINIGWQVEATMESGGMIGENEGVIKNSSTNANCSVSKVEAGGFVGDNDGKIYQCISTGIVKGRKDVGGFAGSFTGYAKDCSTSSQVTSIATGKAYVGGFIGLNDKGITEDSSSTGNVTAKGDTVGGFVGMNINKKSAQIRCRVGTPEIKSIVSGGTDVGGFVGSHSGTRGFVKISKCTAYAQVSGKKNTGGFVGKNFGKNGFIDHCFSYSSTKGKVNAGAFVGYNASGGRIQASKKNNSKSVGKKTKFAGKNRGKLKKCK